MSEQHKTISLLNEEGECLSLSTEEAMIRRLHSWKGWKCAAGVENIHINADGNLYVAACMAHGKQGNIYYDQWNLTKEWTTCPANWCMCGHDMQLRKARSEELVEKTNYPPLDNVNKIEKHDWVVPYHFSHFKKYPRYITWELGRRCNYSCSYCHPEISNNFQPHRPIEMLMKGIEIIEEKFISPHLAKWVFTGGEPTIHPSYMDIVKYLREKDHLVHTQTNGSRNAEYMSELIRYSLIGISVHLEFTQDDKLLKKIKAIIETKKNDEVASKNWFGVRIMVAPGDFDRALELKEEALKIPGFAGLGQINMAPLYENLEEDTEDNHHHGRMLNYEKSEYQQILAHS